MTLEHHPWYPPVLVLGLMTALCIAQSQRYDPTWSSINSRPVPQWYNDVKFGIFITWGIYSVPAWSPVGVYSEWYWYNLEQDKHQGHGPYMDFHYKTYGKDFKYQDFLGLWHAELFNPNAWADLILASGAKYVVPVAKHHDGFTWWPEKTSWNWNAYDVGPHRDLLGDLMTAVRSKGLRGCMYYSLYEWYHPLFIGPNPKDYVYQVMLPQMYNVINTYKPDILWTDGEWSQNSDFWNSTYFLAWLYNDSPIKDYVVVNDRWGSECRGKDGGFYTAEYSDDSWLTHSWEENSGLDIHSYGLNRNSQVSNYSSNAEVIRLLIRTVAYGGNLLLNIGPYNDGTIPPLQQERLLAVGAWLKVNGEAIYNTRVWHVQSEPNTAFYTQNSSLKAVYALFLTYPKSRNIILKTPQTSSSTTITLLGDDKPLAFNTTSEGYLSITLPYFSPQTIPCDYAWVLKLTNLS